MDLRAFATSGFTLLETLVALAIFGLAALALVGLEGASVRRTAAIGGQAMAQIVANNLMVETLTDPGSLAVGSREGRESNGGRQWRWQREVVRTADQRIVRINIAVSEEGGTASARLASARSVVQ